MNEREAPTPIGNVFCRGAIALGSGCMRCGRCAVQLAEKVKQLEAAALASAPAAEPVSPMAKMAQALRDKAAAEKASFDARVQSGEWGPAPEARTEADCQPQHVAQVEGDAAVRTLRWNKNVGAFEYPVGTKLYAASAPAQPAQPAAGAVPADPWRDAVINELVVAHIYCKEHDSDPRKAVQDAITWNCQVALDPAVSSAAAALVEQGRSEVTPPTAQPAPQQGEVWSSTSGALAYVTKLMHDVHCARPKDGYTPEQEADLASLRRIAKRIGDDRYQIAATHPAQPAEQAGEDAP